LITIIDNCSFKEELVKRRVDEILKGLKNKSQESNENEISYNDQGWRVVDKGGKFRNSN